MTILNQIKTLLKHIILFFIGGLIYYLIEILWRGYSHISMIFCGGGCFILIGLVNEIIPWEVKLWKQMLLGSIIVTIVEFFTGCIVNLWLKWNVWDYSNLPFNILGQVCLPFCIAWFFISLLAIVIDDYLRYWLFNEEKPHYSM